eukprot:3135365-Rhodomonas_salina.1
MSGMQTQMGLSGCPVVLIIPCLPPCPFLLPSLLPPSVPSLLPSSVQTRGKTRGRVGEDHQTRGGVRIECHFEHGLQTFLSLLHLRDAPRVHLCPKHFVSERQHAQRQYKITIVDGWKGRASIATMHVQSYKVLGLIKGKNTSWVVLKPNHPAPNMRT